MGVTNLSSRGRGGRGGNRASHGQGGRGGSNRPRPPCWNCGSWEDFKASCPEPDISATSNGPTAASANLAAEGDSEDNGVFAIDDLSDHDSICSIPSLLPTYSSDDDNDE